VERSPVEVRRNQVPPDIALREVLGGSALADVVLHHSLGKGASESGHMLIEWKLRTLAFKASASEQLPPP
jgi:hypothetical protein